MKEDGSEHKSKPGGPDKSPEVIRQMFHDISPTYDFLNHLLSFNIDVRWRRYMAKQVVGPGTHSVLDVCSGTGDLALALARRLEQTQQTKHCKIISTDFTAAMSRLASRKFKQLAPDVPLATIVSDTLNLPFADDAFDLVTVAFGIRNVADLRAGLSEIVRVCRPGGTVAVLEFSEPANPVFRALYHLYFFRILPWVGRLISGTKAYTYLPVSVADFPHGFEFRHIVARHAGGKVKSIPLTLGIATLYTATVVK